MKNIRVLILSLCMMLALCLFAFAASAADVVYVKDGGNGNGSSADAAFGDLADAMAALKNGGTIVLAGDCSVEKSANFDSAVKAFTAPSTNGTVVITSSDNGKNTGARLIFPDAARFFCTGNTTFENITFYNANNKTLVMAGRFFELTFGKGVVMSNIEVHVVGGMEHTNAIVSVPDDDYSKDAHLTLLSGKYAEVTGLGRNTGKAAGGRADYSGTAYITIGGDATVDKVFGAFRWGSKTQTSGNVNITLDGGAVTNFVTGCGSEKITYTCDVTITLTENFLPGNYITAVTPGWSTANVWHGITGGPAYGKDYVNYGTATLDLSRAQNVKDGWLEKCVNLDSFDTVIPFDPSKVPEDSGSQETESKFKATRSYAEQFTDVTTAHWFHPYVKTAYEYALANGTSASKFSPDDKFTVAQALTAAANIHTAYTGNTVRAAAAGEAWYAPYVEYCVENGIIYANQFSDLNKNISRGDMAIVFANILPDEEYEAVRSGKLPDVGAALPSYVSIMRLYNAGIVGGDAGTGNFRPNDEISRAEACVIFTRIAAPEFRQK